MCCTRLGAGDCSEKTRRRTAPEWVTIFTDAQAAIKRMAPERLAAFTNAQAAIKRMASEEPGPDQTHALQARKHIAALRRARPDITIEIKSCPAHKGVPGNEKADEWAKLAAEEPDARGTEWTPNLQEVAQDAKLAEARYHGYEQFQEASRGSTG